MDDNLKVEIKKLKGLSSEEAAAWLMETYPYDSTDYGQAIKLLAHKSWKKQDQVRLAKYYFNKIPFSNSKPYEVFTSFMSLDNFINAIREHLPKEESDMNLLKYHLGPVLRKAAKTDSSHELVEQFLNELR